MYDLEEKTYFETLEELRESTDHPLYNTSLAFCVNDGEYIYGAFTVDDDGTWDEFNKADDDEIWDYNLYDSSLKLIDSGQICSITYYELMKNVLKSNDIIPTHMYWVPWAAFNMIWENH